MVYVADIEDDHALIFDGPVAASADPTILTSSDLAHAKGSWEYSMLPSRAAEWPALKANATDAIRRIEAHLSAGTGRSILDVGCGWGFFLAVAKERGWVPYGLEPLPASATFARATFGIDVTTDTLREDTYPPSFFDAVTAFQVFEHLPLPDEVLGYLHRMLRDGGLLFIEVPNIDTWSVRLMRARHRHFVQDHLNFFSIETLSRLLEKHGFAVLDAYKPTRRMTVRHLCTQWGGRYLPDTGQRCATSLARRLGLWESILSLNVGDIVAVLARKVG